MTLTTERQQFEEWFTNKYPRSYWGVEKTASGEYQGGLAAPLWEAWQESREFLANREAQPVYQMRLLDGTPEQHTWVEVTHEEFNLPLKNPDEWSKRVLFTAPPAPAGEVVVTRNERGDIVAVTRQDGEGRVIEVIDESNAPPAPAVPDEISSAIRYLKDTLVACNRFNYCADAVQRVENACRAAMLAAAPEGGWQKLF